MAFIIFVISISQIAKAQYRIVMQEKIFKVTDKFMKSVKIFSLEVFRLYGNK